MVGINNTNIGIILVMRVIQQHDYDSRSTTASQTQISFIRIKINSFSHHSSILIISEINEKSSWWWNYRFSPQRCSMLSFEIDLIKKLVSLKKKPQTFYHLWTERQRITVNKHKAGSSKSKGNFTFYWWEFSLLMWHVLQNNRKAPQKKQANEWELCDWTLWLKKYKQNWFSCSVNTQSWNNHSRTKSQRRRKK